METKYKLEVEEGYYENDSLILLVIQVFLHRLMHLIKHGEFKD
jgi:hypothetical protein